MNRCCTLAAIAALSSVASATLAGPLTFDAEATLTSPSSTPYKATHHPDNGYYAVVPITSFNQFVQVSGGQPNSLLGVSYTMNITVSTGYNGVTTLQEDSTNGNALVQLDPSGTFREKALGSGSLSANLNDMPTPPGHNPVATAHSEITYSVDPTQKALTTPDPQVSFSVIPSN